MNRPTVCFIHIPKTAGSSVRDALARVLGGFDRILWLGVNGTVDDFTAATEKDLAQYAVIGGHVDVPSLQKIEALRQPVVYATIFREPVARAISFYEYIVRGGDADHPLRPELAEIGLRRAIVENEGFRREIGDAQCRNLAEAATFDAAREVLRDNRWIYGTTEAPQKVIDRVAKVLGKRSVALIHANASKPGYFSRLATPEIADMIANLNREDLKLYDLVSARGLKKSYLWLGHKFRKQVQAVAPGGT